MDDEEHRRFHNVVKSQLRALRQEMAWLLGIVTAILTLAIGYVVIQYL